MSCFGFLSVDWLDWTYGWLCDAGSYVCLETLKCRCLQLARDLFSSISLLRVSSNCISCNMRIYIRRIYTCRSSTKEERGKERRRERNFWFWFTVWGGVKGGIPGSATNGWAGTPTLHVSLFGLSRDPLREPYLLPWRLLCFKSIFFSASLKRDNRRISLLMEGGTSLTTLTPLSVSSVIDFFVADLLVMSDLRNLCSWPARERATAYRGCCTL